MTMAIIATTAFLLIPGCGEDGILGPGDCGSPPATDDHAGMMRSFVQDLSAHARTTAPSFIVIAQNGLPLLATNGRPDGPLDDDYLAAISGIGQEALYYDLGDGDVPTTTDQREEMFGYLDRMVPAAKTVLATSYCQVHENMDDAYASSLARGYLAFAAPSHDLDVIPDHPAAPHQEHAGQINQLGDARNYLLLTDPGSFADREDYLTRLAATNYDILILEAFLGDTMLTPDEMDSLRTKQNGGQRLVLASLPIALAETDGVYWQEEWVDDPPSWLEDPLDDDPGSFLVEYWKTDWQAIIFGTPEAELDRIVAAGFDGVYLTSLEAYEAFEDADG